jgi:adenine-specific DNA-methyltransferase
MIVERSATITMKTEHHKSSGVYYTPPSVVSYIVREAIEALLERGCGVEDLRILDPACGDGIFLQESSRFLSTKGRRRQAGHRLGQIFGVDIDRNAVLLARRRLEAEFHGDPKQVQHNIRHGDALLGTDGPPRGNGPMAEAPLLDWRATFPEVFAAGGFDAIVGNPPYVNIRILTKTRGPEVKRYFSEHFRCARRAYDLYVLFLEQAYRLLRPGGVCGMIVPNKIAEMEYARACRNLLLERTSLLQIIDVSNLKLFSKASVFPYILIWRKVPPVAGHSFAMKTAQSEGDLAVGMPGVEIEQSRQSADRGFDLHGDLDIESRVATQPLDQRAALLSGTTGFVAERLAQEVVEQESVPSADYHDFIVSRNIDRFAIQRGDVRFMKRKFRRPALPANSPLLSPAKRQLFRNAKIVVAGMTRRLEAAWDRGGLALGVQVYAVTPFDDDPHFLLGLLNSKLMSYIFQLRFRAKKLSGGYFAVNKRQLARLPIRVWHDTLPDSVQELAGLVRKMIDLPPDERAGTLGARIDSKIDNLVYRMYNLSEREVEQVETTVV